MTLPLATLDMLVLAVLLLSLALGAWRGLVYELFYLVGWVVAFIGARFAAPLVVLYAQPYTQQWPASAVHALLFVLTFIAIVFLWGLLASMAKKMVQAVGLRPVDRVLGACFGAVRAGVLLLLLTVVAQATAWQGQAWWQQSYAGPWMQRSVATVLADGGPNWRQWLP